MEISNCPNDKFNYPKSKKKKKKTQKELKNQHDGHCKHNSNTGLLILQSFYEVAY